MLKQAQRQSLILKKMRLFRSNLAVQDEGCTESHWFYSVLHTCCGALLKNAEVFDQSPCARHGIYPALQEEDLWQRLII